MSNNAQKAAVKAVKDDKQLDTHVLSTGYTVSFKPVSRFVLLDATQNIKDPPIPIIVDEVQGKEFPNPNDPGYLKDIEDNGQKRSMALAEVTLMLGVEVQEPLPEDDTWLTELQWLAKRGRINLDEYDLDSPLDKMYVWKRFVVFGDNDDFAKLMAQASGVDEEVVAQSMRTFQRDALRDSDNGSGSKESEELS